MGDTNRTPQEFAEERSHRDAQVSNETGRAAGQAIILINGGAATAVLAYLAKGYLPSAITLQAALCLLGYMVGVALGACMLFASMRSLDYYSARWRDFAHPNGFADSPLNPSARATAFSWAQWSYRLFWAATTVFLLSSVLVAMTLAGYTLTLRHSVATFCV